MESFFVGVDVGTASVRAALVDKSGSIRLSMQEPITINNPQPGFYEQSSDEIWDKCCKLVKVGLSVLLPARKCYFCICS